MDLNYDPFYPDSSVTDHSLSVWAKHHAFSQKAAFTWVDGKATAQRTLTFSSLDCAASAVATHLQRRRQEGLILPQQSTLLLLYPPGLEFIEVLFGCQRAGLTIVPLLPPQPHRSSSLVAGISKLEKIAKEVRPAAVLAPSQYASAFKQLLSELSDVFPDVLIGKLTWIDPIIHSQTTLMRSRPHSSAEGNRAHDVYLVQYTSGATGPPKPTLITAGAAAHNARTARKAYGLNPSSVIVSWLPLYHDCGLMFIHLSIVTGATSFLTSPFTFSQNPTIWLQMLSKFKGTCTPVPAFALPLVARKHVHDNTLDLSSVSSLIVVNEPVEADKVAKFCAKFEGYGLKESSIAPSYGLAENCTFVSTAWVDGGGTLPPHDGLLPSGRVAEPEGRDEMDIRIVRIGVEKRIDGAKEEAMEGEEGEVWVASPSNACGYLGMSHATRHVFGGRLTLERSKQYVRTGDTGVLKRGFIYITGRVVDMVLIGMKQVHAHRLERTIYESAPNALRQGYIMAFNLGAIENEVVILAELLSHSVQWGPSIDILLTIRNALFQQHDLVPSSLCLVKPRSLPKTTSGKLQRQLARQLFLQHRIPILHMLPYGYNNLSDGDVPYTTHDHISSLQFRPRAAL